MRISVWSSDVCSSDLPRSEAWKYTPLRALERRAFAPVEAAVAAFDPALIADIPAPRLVFVNGVHDAAHSDADALPDGASLVLGEADRTPHEAAANEIGRAHV